MCKTADYEFSGAAKILSRLCKCQMNTNDKIYNTEYEQKVK